MNIKEVLKRGFESTTSYDDSTPLHSVRHPIFINNIEVEGLWRDLHDVTYRAFVDIDEDGSVYFISPQHEEEYKAIEEVFNKLFLKHNA